jgi:hypothetical protein
MDRPPPRRTAAAALALTLCLAGCGGGGDDALDARRDAVDRYVKDEQAVMQRAQPDFERANEAYQAYANGELEPRAAIRQIRAAQRTIRNARDGLSVLDPPRDAQALHDKLMSYVSANVELAGETSRLAEYVPGAARAVAPLARVNRQLRAGLADAQDSVAQERALERFAAAIGAITNDLRTLRAPLVLESAHGDQIRRLEATRRLAGRLRRGLHDEDAEQVARVLKRFRTASAGGGGRRRLSAQGLAAYSRRLKQLREGYADVRREQLRLARSLREPPAG